MFSIGSVSIPNNLVLAPLAGYTDLSFRLLCREYGAGLCVSEMISCHGLVYKQKNTIQMLDSCKDDQPLSYQLFGSDPGIMAEAASILNDFNPDCIDINMGCPVKKVTKRGAGAALMADLDLAEQIIRAVVSKSKYPVTVKMRSGTDHIHLNAEALASRAEHQGVSALTVHGRTWKQAFTGLADWDVVRKIKQTVSIPVIGNGDVTSCSDAHSLQEATGCDGIMIGRAALGNPWVFHPQGRPRSLVPILRGVLRHVVLLEQHSSAPRFKLAAMKNHLGKYFKGFAGSSAIRKSIYEAADWASLKQMITRLEEQHSHCG